MQARTRRHDPRLIPGPYVAGTSLALRKAVGAAGVCAGPDRLLFTEPTRGQQEPASARRPPPTAPASTAHELARITAPRSQR
jgi:hypothetical protein